MATAETLADYRDWLCTVAVRVSEHPSIPQTDTHHRKIVRRNRLHDCRARFFALLHRSTFYQESISVRAATVAVRDGGGQSRRLHLGDGGETLEKPVVKRNAGRP